MSEKTDLRDILQALKSVSPAARGYLHLDVEKISQETGTGVEFVAGALYGIELDFPQIVPASLEEGRNSLLSEQSASKIQSIHSTERLERLLKILQLLYDNGQNYNVTEVANKLDIPYSSVSKIIADLHELEILDFTFAKSDTKSKLWFVKNKSKAEFLLQISEQLIEEFKQLNEAETLREFLTKRLQSYYS